MRLKVRLPSQARLVQWLRDNLHMFDYSKHVEDYAAAVPDAGGMYIVPAFSGLYAPYWRSDARGCVCGADTVLSIVRTLRVPRWKRRRIKRARCWMR